ncbi:MAG: hypothetical protein ACXAEN_24325 [Candidatus Thorarchaeota archaeon]|jgi:spermidine/putrescine-binding protein
MSDLLKALARGAWTAPQTLTGLARGLLKTGKFPAYGTNPEGNPEYRFNVPEEDPLSMGDVVFAPKDVPADQLAHERVHQRQSRELGPAYIPGRMLGELMSKVDTGDPYYGHPMEHEAYLETANKDDLQNYLAMVEAYRKMNKR